MKKLMLALFILILIPCFCALPEAEGTNGAKLTMISRNDEFGQYMIKVTGFSPGEKVHYTSKSNDEIMVQDITIPSEEFAISHLPGVIGQYFGKATITMTGEHDNTVCLEYHWKIAH